MLTRRSFAWSLFAVAAVGFGLAAGTAQDRKDDKKKEETRKGTVTGLVTARGDNWIEVKADGEEKGRRYVPHWKGGLPANGGGLDKAGCHQDRKRGGYHCHKGELAGQSFPSKDAAQKARQGAGK